MFTPGIERAEPTQISPSCASSTVGHLYFSTNLDAASPMTPGSILAADDNGAFVHKINLLPRHFIRLLENINLQLPAADVILIQFFGNLLRRVHSPCRQS